MEPAEDLPASAAPAPVFVDDTGRRRAITRRAGRILVVGFTAYIGLLVVGFVRDPGLGPIHLPTFGLPSLGPVAPPGPSVLAEQINRTDSDADVEVATGRAPAAGTPDLLTSASGGASPPGPGLTPAGTPAESAPTTTTSGTQSSTTTSTTATSTTTTTSTTTSSEPGRGSGQGSGPVSAKGPDGGGAPGQQRKTTTTTAG